MSELIDRQALENWLRTECYGTDTDDDKEYVIGRLREELPTIAAPRWHRVEDELPDEVGSYLVYAPTYIGGSSSAKECKAGVMFARWLKGGHWSIEVGYYKRPGCVTHWMPIEPPKEDALMLEFAEFVRRSNNSDFAPVPGWNDAVSLLESAPTIIEAEEGEEA